MKTTPQVSAGFAQTAWVAYGMSRRGALAIRRDDRADAGRRTTRVACTRSTRRRRRPPYAYLVRRTGRIAGWREWRRNRARANRYSQEERVTSRHGPYAECYAMSNVIGFFPVKHLGVDSAEPGPFCIYTIAATKLSVTVRSMYRRNV